MSGSTRTVTCTTCWKDVPYGEVATHPCFVGLSLETPGPSSQSPQDEFNFEQGILERESGKDLVSIKGDNFLGLMRSEAARIAKNLGSVTIDDLRRLAIERNIKPHHPNVWGAIFRGDKWVSTGFTQSELVSNHARTIRVWRLKREHEDHRM